MYQRILVPLDGSQAAMQALPHVTTIAQALGARIELVEVVSPFPRQLARAATQYSEGWPTYPPSPEQWSEIRSRSRNEAQGRLEAAAAPLREAGLTVSQGVVEDEPAKGIAQAAARETDTLIAMSTHGRTGIGRWVVGSVTDKVIRVARDPVLVVRAREGAAPPLPPRLTRVILPLDGSDVSEAAVPHAIELAKGLGVGVILLRAISPLAYGDTFAEYVPSMYKDLSTAIDAEVRNYLQRMVVHVRSEGVADVLEHAIDGYAATVILDEAGEEGDKLVVMATHARTGVGRVVLGSVTDRVVRHASCPVLIVRPGKPEE